MNPTTDRLLRLHEGVRSKRYLDGEGHPTIGVGHNLDAAPPCAAVVALQAAAGLPADDDWLDASVDAQLAHDVDATCAWLRTRPWWASLSQVRQAALEDMAFNLGEKKDEAFTTFFGLVAVGVGPAAPDDLVGNTQMKPGHPLHRRYVDLGKILVSDSTAGVLP